MIEVKIGQYYTSGKSLLRIEKIDENYYWYRDITFNYTSRLSINLFELNYSKGYFKYSPRNSELWKVLNE